MGEYSQLVRKHAHALCQQFKPTKDWLWPAEEQWFDNTIYAAMAALEADLLVQRPAHAPTAEGE